MQISVFGAGSLGTLVGGLLARKHEVTLVGRNPHVSRIDAEGLPITGAIDETVHPDARTDLPDQTELVVVTVKSFDTETAARQLRQCRLDGVLSLQNGMGNEELLAAALDVPVLAGTCTYGARISHPGTVECTGIGEITVGPRGGDHSAFADEVGDAFKRAGVVTAVSTDMERMLWEKLAVNAGINATTALARIPNGALIDDPIGDVATRAAREAGEVARAHGVALDGETATARTRAVAEATAENTSSMHQDILSRRRTEIDAINGYVLKHATQSVPVNETLTALVRSWEREQGLRE